MSSRFALLLGLITILSGFAQEDQGGPDGFGYYWESTLDPGDTIHFFWLDPTGHQPITDWTPNPDDGWAKIPLPYRFPFYGDTLDSIIVCTNGFLEFPVTLTSYLNQSLPAASFPSLIAVFWDDLAPNRSGSIRVFNNPSESLTCITWHNVVRFNTADTLSCQVLLYANGLLRMNYLRAPATVNSSTIGIQGHSGQGNYYLQFLFNGEPSYHLPGEASAIRFYVRRLEHDVGVSHVASPKGWIPPNGQSPVQAILKNYGLNTEDFPVSAWIVRTRFPNDTVFHSSLTVRSLAPSATTLCYFGDLLTGPSPDSWSVLVRTDLPNDMFRRNDTCRVIASSVPPPFGTTLAFWDLPELGDGMNLSGITYCPGSNRFYMAVNDPNRIYSFPASGPDSATAQEPFQLQNFFGDDLVWGIAWNDTPAGFWLTHLSANGSGCILARYLPDGTFSGDTWNLTSIEPGAWFAGIDQGPDHLLFATEVGGHNRIYALNLSTKSTAWFLPGPVASYRACCYIGDQNCYLLSGGWNDNNLVKLDRAGNLVQSAWLPDLADLDIYRPCDPCPDSLLWAYLTKNNRENTIQQVSIGTLWQNIGIAETDRPSAPARPFHLLPNPVAGNSVLVQIDPTEPRTRLSLWDMTGRCWATWRVDQGVRTNKAIRLSLSNRHGQPLPAGIYFLRLNCGAKSYTAKLLLLPKS
ncbi:MAG: T9SS type A sorting domain-containing protein [candidate division WOR-3 bacterium]